MIGWTVVADLQSAILAVLHASAWTGRTLVLAERVAAHPQLWPRGRLQGCHVRSGRGVFCLDAEQLTGNRIVLARRLISLRRATLVGVLAQAGRREKLESPDPSVRRRELRG